jgi:hypothetical protein
VVTVQHELAQCLINKATLQQHQLTLPACRTVLTLQAGGGFVLLSMAIGLLLPLLLASAAFVTITWVWAAATTLALASTPIMSQCGLALWFLGQAYFLVGGGDPIKCEPTGTRARVGR